MHIGLLSDTHGHLDEAIITHLKSCDEIWHAGDFGAGVAKRLGQVTTLRGVFGNVDDQRTRREFPEVLSFEVQGLKVAMIHIGGYPGRYTPKAKAVIEREHPALFISGHSHILKVMPGELDSLLHINPGAAGYEGFHQVRTMVTFTVRSGKLSDLKVIELGPRSTMERAPNIIT